MARAPQRKAKHPVARSKRSQPPYVASAFLCENVLREAGGVLSAIRIVDQFNVPEVPPDSLEAKIEVSILAYALITLKPRGKKAEKHTMRVLVRRPSGVEKAFPLGSEGEEEIELALGGGSSGANVVIRFTLDPRGEMGLYHLVLLIDGEILTKIPFTLRVQESAKQELG